jgi:hypothetical protein
LASILAGLGLAVVHGAAWLQRRSVFNGLARFAPLATSVVISIIGATMVAQGLHTLLAVAPFALILLRKETL